MPIEMAPWTLTGGGSPPAPEPFDLVAGDTLSWSRFFNDYPASQGWVLSYVLNSTTARFVVNSGDITTQGDTFNILIPSSETKTWTPGRYQWLAVVVNSGLTPAQRATVALGRVNVAIDLLDATSPQDTRSPAEINLTNIDLMLGGRASDGVQEYTINGRMLKRYPMDELLQLRAYYLAIVRQERYDRGEIQRPRRVAVHF
jgi:hypothetical protein